MKKMAQTLEDMKGSGGSVKVGSTGTISSLMTRELKFVISAPQTPRPQTVLVSVPCSATTPKRPQPRKLLDETSSSRSSNSFNHKNSEICRKTKGYAGKTHRVPMLGSDHGAFVRTPTRGKTEKKGPSIVEIVDIKCGNPARAWASPVTSRLKKLGFSKLSESII